MVVYLVCVVLLINGERYTVHVGPAHASLDTAQAACDKQRATWQRGSDVVDYVVEPVRVQGVFESCESAVKAAVSSVKALFGQLAAPPEDATAREALALTLAGKLEHERMRAGGYRIHDQMVYPFSEDILESWSEREEVASLIDRLTHHATAPAYRWWGIGPDRQRLSAQVLEQLPFGARAVMRRYRDSPEPEIMGGEWSPSSRPE